ncbi:putative protein-like [Raphanus sativus]|nr:putative protein-like [Raphanus sativus]
MMLARIIDEERDYDRQSSPSDTWNYWLNVKQKTIWWEELYELDQAARVFPKKKDKAKVEFAEGSSSQTSLDSNLKGLEGSLVKFMGTAFASLNFTVEAKLESIDLRMSKMEERLTSIESKLSEEKNQAKDKGDKEEAGKNGEGEQEAGKSEGEGNKDKKNSETDEEDGSEQERELNRMKDDELWRSLMENREEVGRKLMEDQEEVGGKVMEDQEEAETSEEVIENSPEEPMVEAEISEPRVAAEISEARVAAEISEARVESPIKEPHFESPIKEPRVEAHQTPTTPSGGRTKAMAARRVVNSPITTWAAVMEARKAVQAEEKTSEKIVEEETEKAEKIVEEETEEAEKVVEEQTGEVVEEYTEEEKQRCVMVVCKACEDGTNEERTDGNKEARRPEIRHRCKEKTMAYGKPTPKRGRPKKSDCTPHASKRRGKRMNHQSGCRLLSRQGRSLKQRLKLKRRLMYLGC